MWVIRNRKENLGFGLDFDFKRVDPGGENTGEILTGARVEEIETWLSQFLESTPFFNNPYTCLVYATHKNTRRVPHHLLQSQFSPTLYVSKYIWITFSENIWRDTSLRDYIYMNFNVDTSETAKTDVVRCDAWRSRRRWY